MKQNESAYEHHVKAGETQFNEAAFWQGKSLYQGELDGQPFSSVVKTFQVKTWRQIKQRWNQLEMLEQSELADIFPGISSIR